MRPLLTALLVLSAAAATVHADPVPWQWDSASPDLFPRADLAVDHAGTTYRLALTTVKGKDHLALGNGTWTVAPAGFTDDELTGAALAADDARVYLATYNRIATGCTLAAYAASDGKLLWTVSLEGAGPVAHSKYFNRVQLGLVAGKPVVFGSEGAARYVEVRDPASGKLIENTRLPAVYPERPLAEPLFVELDRMLESHATYKVGANDFLARHVLLKDADHAARGAAFREAARRLDGTPIQHGRYKLRVMVTEHGGDFEVTARRD